MLFCLICWIGWRFVCLGGLICLIVLLWFLLFVVLFVLGSWFGGLFGCLFYICSVC